MKHRLLTILITCSMLCAVWLPNITIFAEDAAAADNDQSVSIKVVHTNDIHGRSSYQAGSVIGFEKLKTWITQQEPDLVLDGGDTFHGQAFATLEQGKSIAELMEVIGYDAMTPGNHDWNYGKEQLKTLGADAQTPVLAGNITQQQQNFFGNDGTLIKEIHGVKVGILGVYDQDIRSKTAPRNIEGLTFDNDAQKANELAQRLRQQGCDVVIALSHQSYIDTFVKQIKGIDMLIAGHEHVVLDAVYTDAEGKPVKVAEAGSYFKNAGVLTISYNKEKQRIEDISETVISDNEASGLESDTEVTAILLDIKARQSRQLEQTIGSVGVDLEGRWQNLRIAETNLGRVITAAYLEETGADIAIENAGGIRIGRTIPAGLITYKDVLDIAPFGNYIVTKKIKGSSVKFLLEKSVELGVQNRESYDEWVKTGSTQVRWPENSGSYLQFGGLTASYDTSKPEGKRVSGVKVAGIGLKKDELYTVATNNYASISETYPELAAAKEENEYSACDEALIRFIEKGQIYVDQAASAVALQESKPVPEQKPSQESLPTKPTTVKNPMSGVIDKPEQEKADTDTLPKTGDSVPVGVIAAIILCAAAIILITIVLRRKSQQK